MKRAVPFSYPQNGCFSLMPTSSGDLFPHSLEDLFIFHPAPATCMSDIRKCCIFPFQGKFSVLPWAEQRICTPLFFLVLYWERFLYYGVGLLNTQRYGLCFHQFSNNVFPPQVRPPLYLLVLKGNIMISSESIYRNLQLPGMLALTVQHTCLWQITASQDFVL